VPQSDDDSSPSAGHLLGRFGLLLALAVLVLSAWFGQMVIVVLTGLVISTIGLARLWSRLSLTKVDCQRLVSERRAFPGEEIELKLRLVNRKLLPLPWVRVDDNVPHQLLTADTAGGEDALNGSCVSRLASLLWYSGVTWRYRLRCQRRGYYPLGPTTISSGDIFGFYPRYMTQANIDHVIVYPRLFPLSQLGLPSLFPLGETRAERRIFEDPTRTIGIRDYTPQDSLRHIHWKASARHQNLEVKVYEPTTTLSVILFLAVDSFPSHGAGAEDDFELGVSTVASVANYVVEQRSPVGLFVNTLLPDSGQPVRLAPAGGLGQLVTIMESLAKVTMASSGSFDEFLQSIWDNLPWGATIVIVIHRPVDFLDRLLYGLRETGYKVAVLQIGERTASNNDYGVSWYNIRSEDDLLGSGLRGVR